MIVDTPLQLGQSTNLLSGYEANITSAPFRPSKKPALYETQIKLKDPDYEAVWSWPTITLHETAEDLISTLVQVKLRKESFEDTPSEGGGEARWPAGALMLAGLTAKEHQQVIKNLSSQLGLNLSTSGWSYALVRRTRLVGAAAYKSYERGLFANIDTERISRPDALAALKELEKLGPHSTDVTKDGANGYIDFFETYGSHFVSRIEAGDLLFQVFAYGAEEFKFIVDFYADKTEFLTGAYSTSFVQYTVPHNEAGHGYTAATGTILCASGDPKLARSLEQGLWLDKQFSGKNNIFTPSVTSGGININETLKSVTVIWIELASLNAFAEYYRKLIWRRVFKAAMYAKYAMGLGVAPYFCNNCPYDFEAVYMDSHPIDEDGLVSTLATPAVHIWQELVNLGLIKLQFPQVVGKFSAFANVIKFPSPANSADIQVPGSSTISLLAHVVSTGGVGPIPYNLQISQSAFKKIKDQIFCGEFYGGLRVSNLDGSQSLVIMNGLIFECKDKISSVVRDIRVSPPLDYLAERLTDIQFGLVAAEARLNFFLTDNSEAGQKAVYLIQRYLLWLGNLGTSDQQSKNDKIATLQARALYLANVAAMGPGAGIPVPYLKYDAYKDVVKNVENVLRTAVAELANKQQQIRQRMVEERLIHNPKVLNENIIASGQLLLDYIAAQASLQGKIASIFEKVISNKDKEFKMATQRAKKLSASLEEQRGIVEEAVAEYKKNVVNWQQREMIRAAIDIALNLFVVGFTFSAPVGSIQALKSLSATVQKIQRAVFIFDSVIQAYQGIGTIPNNPQSVVDALNGFDEVGMEMPATLEWGETKKNMDAVLATGPNIAAKYTLSAAFSVLVLRGKALLQCQDTIQKIASDLSTAKARLKLSQEQKKRLNDLNTILSVKPENLEVANVDLVGLSGQLIFFERQMMMALAETVVIQDRALQYEYIRPPAPIESFTVFNLQLVIVSQSLSINQGITAKPPPQDQEYPIIYEVHGVKPENLINNQAYTFNIAPNKREFVSYNHIRVKQVDVNIGGINSTQSGKYYTELTFDGNPFYDKGFNGDALTFQTVSRIYTGHHDVSGSSHIPPAEKSAPAQKTMMYLGSTGQSSIDDKISDITPFSTWKVSLPPTSTNENIKFDNCPRGVTVRLIFYINAQLKEEIVQPSEMFQRSRDLIISRGHGLNHRHVAPAIKLYNMPGKRQEIDSSVNRLRQVSQSTVFHRGGRNVGETDVLGMMAGKSVCAGWDVVFSMTAKEVNEQLRLQFEDRQGVPEFVRETGDVSSENTTSEGIPVKTSFNFKFNAPRLEFLLNNSNSAQVFLPIMSGHYEYSIFANGAWFLIEQADVQELDGSYVRGDVPLAVLAGSVSSQDNICVELNGGGFSAENFEASTNNPYFNSVLNHYFTHLQDGYEVYNFGTLDYQGVSVIEAMKPSAFLFNIYHTPSDRDLLQLFIATTGQLQSATFLYLQEPIPTLNQSSMIINTKMFFQDVLPASLGDGGIGLTLKANAPSNDSNKDKIWSSTATSGTVSAYYPETMVGESEEYFPTFGTYHKEYYVRVPGNRVHVDLTSMTLRTGDADSLWHVKEAYDLKQASYDFEYGYRQRQCDSLQGCSPWSKIFYHWYSLLVNIGMKTGLPFKVTGTGLNQELQIASASSDVVLTGNVEPPAACDSNDSELQQAFLDNLKEYLPPEMMKVFNRSFNSVSLFALKNILFPAKNVMDMTKAHVPGDMIIFGNFTDTAAK